MIFTIELKRRVTGAGILSIIVSKLRDRKKLCPIILLKFDKGPNIGFYYVILPLNLAIRLQVEGGGEFLLNA